VVDQRWISTAATWNAMDRFQYGYDRDGNPLYRKNTVNTAFSELYHANGSSNGYDGLNRLVAFSRGTLNGTNDTISSPAHSQSYTLDSQGNFSTVVTDSSTQTRTHNQQNQIGNPRPIRAHRQAISSSKTGRQHSGPMLDSNGLNVKEGYSKSAF
jgi:hypothetical protein